MTVTVMERLNRTLRISFDFVEGALPSSTEREIKSFFGPLLIRRPWHFPKQHPLYNSDKYNSAAPYFCSFKNPAAVWVVEGQNAKLLSHDIVADNPLGDEDTIAEAVRIGYPFSYAVQNIEPGMIVRGRSIRDVLDSMHVCIRFYCGIMQSLQSHGAQLIFEIPAHGLHGPKFVTYSDHSTWLVGDCSLPLKAVAKESFLRQNPWFSQARSETHQNETRPMPA